MTPSVEKKPDPKPDKQIVIHIDRKQFKVEADEMTGAELRAVPEPDIGPEFDLWREVPGDEDDRVEADEKVRLTNGVHFFTAPSTINPGRAD